MLDTISQYSPVVIINGLAAILFMIGYVLFGVAMIQIRTATLPRWAGILVAVGAPAHLLGSGSADLDRRRPIAILGSASLGAGLAWPGYRLWHAPDASDVAVPGKPTCMRTGSSDNAV